MCEGGASSKVVPAAGEDLLGPRSGKQKQCPGGSDPYKIRLPLLFLFEILEETLLAD